MHIENKHFKGVFAHHCPSPLCTEIFTKKSKLEKHIRDEQSEDMHKGQLWGKLGNICNIQCPLSTQIYSYVKCSNSHVSAQVFFKKKKDTLNSESWSRATLHKSRLPQSAILFQLVAPTGRGLLSAAKGEFSHSIDGHVQGVHGHVPCVPGVQGVPAWIQGGVQPSSVQTRGL